MWCYLFTKFASYKVPPVMVSTHGAVVPLAMFWQLYSDDCKFLWLPSEWQPAPIRPLHWTSVLLLSCLQSTEPHPSKTDTYNQLFCLDEAQCFEDNSEAELMSKEEVESVLTVIPILFKKMDFKDIKYAIFSSKFPTQKFCGLSNMSTANLTFLSWKM